MAVSPQAKLVPRSPLMYGEDSAGKFDMRLIDKDGNVGHAVLQHDQAGQRPRSRNMSTIEYVNHHKNMAQIGEESLFRRIEKN